MPGYDIQRLIARGGFGSVYEARQAVISRTVALKVLAAGVLGTDADRRFQAECRSIGGLSWHHHVVALHDAGSTPSGDRYLAMEYLPAGSLGDRLRTDGPLDRDEIVKVGVQVASALSAAHAAGVLHRDVKPDNVLVDRDGGYQLTDFGIASLADSTQSVTGAFTGTYAFCAPELLQGKRAAEQSDVYGLGATLYALAAGQAAFVTKEDATPAAVILRIVSQPADPLPAWVPDDLRAVISRAMAKEPTNRYQSARELLEAIEALDRSGDARPGRHPKHVAGLSSSSPQETSLDEASTVTRKVPVPPLDAPTVARSAPTPANQDGTGSAPAGVLHDLPRAGKPSHDQPDAEGVATGGRSRWMAAGALAAALVLVAIGALALITGGSEKATPSRGKGQDATGDSATTSQAASSATSTPADVPQVPAGVTVGDVTLGGTRKGTAGLLAELRDPCDLLASEMRAADVTFGVPAPAGGGCQRTYSSSNGDGTITASLMRGGFDEVETWLNEANPSGSASGLGCCPYGMEYELADKAGTGISAHILDLGIIFEVTGPLADQMGTGKYEDSHVAEQILNSVIAQWTPPAPWETEGPVAPAGLNAQFLSAQMKQQAAAVEEYKEQGYGTLDLPFCPILGLDLEGGWEPPVPERFGSVEPLGGWSAADAVPVGEFSTVSDDGQLLTFNTGPASNCQYNLGSIADADWPKALLALRFVDQGPG